MFIDPSRWPRLIARWTGRLLLRRAFWCTVVTLGFMATFCCGIFCSIGGLPRWSRSEPWPMLGYVALYIVISLGTAAVFVRGNEWEWMYSLQFLAVIVPTVILIHCYSLASGDESIFLLSGFISISGFLFWKWLYLTIPDECQVPEPSPEFAFPRNQGQELLDSIGP